MFKKLSFFLLATLSITAAHAGYAPVAVSGYTADVVANGTGTALSSITLDVDGAGYAFQASDFNAGAGTPTSYMPTGGFVTSVGTPGMTYQMASYSSNNSLRLAATNASGTLTFNTPTTAGEVWLMGTSGSGASTFSVSVNFTDNTTQVFTGITNFTDWYGGTPFVNKD